MPKIVIECEVPEKDCIKCCKRMGMVAYSYCEMFGEKLNTKGNSVVERCSACKKAEVIDEEVNPYILTGDELKRTEQEAKAGLRRG